MSGDVIPTWQLEEHFLGVGQFSKGEMFRGWGIFLVKYAQGFFRVGDY